MTTQTVHCATWNVGNAKPREVLDLLRDEWLWFLFLCEMSDRRDITSLLAREGFGLINPTRVVGQAGTVVVYDQRRARLRTEFSHRLTDQGVKLGKGTGPDRGKAKFYTGGTFVLPSLGGRRLRFGGVHAYASQKWPKKRDPNLRAILSRRMVDKAEMHAVDDYHGVNVMAGDFNANPDRPTVKPLTRQGWVCNHTELGGLTTHPPGWKPDHLYLLDPGERQRARMVDHHTVKGTGSDHRPLVVDVEVRAKGER